MIDIFNCDGTLPGKLLGRARALDDKTMGDVRAIIDDVRARGDEAIREYTRLFDGADVACARVDRAELDEAENAIEPRLWTALVAAHKSIRAYHEKQARQSFILPEPGRTTGQLILPLDSAGVYVPGGTAAYPSSALMNIIPAKAAGVRRIVMTTPPGPDGRANPAVLAAARLAGADEIYKIGGAQAIAAMAYGTRTITPVCKVTGPGNRFVACAKRLVYGDVGVDMIAGPSEVMVIADDSADARFVAADLLSQAEHDELAAAVLVTTSGALATAVRAELDRQLSALSRGDIARASLENFGAALIVSDLGQAAQAANAFAPEHLELCVSDPYALLPHVKNAGSVFLGHFSPEPLGDYMAGPNHVLPTSGTARFSSPLGVDDFVKRMSFINFSRDALASLAPDIEAIAMAEGLDAHLRSVAIRLEGKP